MQCFVAWDFRSPRSSRPPPENLHQNQPHETR
nr:MAG TPA: hypothetical protein [Caudoviricetes sp.]